MTKKKKRKKKDIARQKRIIKAFPVFARAIILLFYNIIVSPYNFSSIRCSNNRKRIIISRIAIALFQILNIIETKLSAPYVVNTRILL